jgi:hypothetical protein
MLNSSFYTQLDVALLFLWDGRAGVLMLGEGGRLIESRMTEGLLYRDVIAFCIKKHEEKEYTVLAKFIFSIEPGVHRVTNKL